MLKFSKMQGIGNDFIIINCIDRSFNYSLSVLAKYLCNRNFGIGADGVIYIFESSLADYKMRIFNCDGSEAEMCGNGIRCMGKYLYEKGMITKNECTIETLAGVKKLEMLVQGKSVISVKVRIGKAYFDSSLIPAYLPQEEIKKEYHSVKIAVENNQYIFNLVSVGNPHAVCFVNDIHKENIEKIGPIVENYKYFPKKINVELAQIIDYSNMKIKVWERGVRQNHSVVAQVLRQPLFVLTNAS